jgi:hypothetical protein
VFVPPSSALAGPCAHRAQRCTSNHPRACRFRPEDGSPACPALARPRTGNLRAGVHRLGNAAGTGHLPCIFTVLSALSRHTRLFSFANSRLRSGGVKSRLRGLWGGRHRTLIGRCGPHSHPRNQRLHCLDPPLSILHCIARRVAAVALRCRRGLWVMARPLLCGRHWWSDSPLYAPSRGLVVYTPAESVAYEELSRRLVPGRCP